MNRRIKMRLFPRNRRVADCVEPTCSPERQHCRCRECDRPTDRWTIAIDYSLRRRKAFVCTGCMNDPAFSERQERLSEKRTKMNWQWVTDPLNPKALRLGVFPEQHPSEARQVLRAFLASSAKVGVIDGVSAGTLESSILTLGLRNDLYAETRSGQTVLCRIGGVKGP